LFAQITSADIPHPGSGVFSNKYTGLVRSMRNFSAI
jgi:hypothetical protein